jgi:prepilin signal peptidase PulO-like enzyme (type II secretory pathway)
MIDEEVITVRTGIPYMIYISGGFVVQLIFGDLIFNTIKLSH